MKHWFKRLYWRLEVLFRKDRPEAELEEEIRYHLEREIDANVRAGMSAAEARRKAMVEFGGVEQTKEQVRDVRGARILDDLLRRLSLGIKLPVPLWILVRRIDDWAFEERVRHLQFQFSWQLAVEDEPYFPEGATPPLRRNTGLCCGTNLLPVGTRVQHHRQAAQLWPPSTPRVSSTGGGG